MPSWRVCLCRRFKRAQSRSGPPSPAISRGLQGRSAAHQGVQLINAGADGALGRPPDLHGRIGMVAQPIGRYELAVHHAGQGSCQHLLRAVKVQIGRIQHARQGAQYLPCGACFGQGLDHCMEALQAPFGIDEAARGLAERADGQQHIADVEVGFERTQGDDGLRRLQALQRRFARCAIPLRLYLQQHRRLECALHHLAGVQAASLRHGTHALGAHGVGRLGQVAEACAGLLGNPLHQRQQAGCLRMMRRRIAQQDGCAPASQQRLRNGLRSSSLLARLFCRFFCGAGHICLLHHGQGHAFFGRHGRCNASQRLRPITRICLQHGAQWHGPIGRGIYQGANLRALTHRLTDALGKQGVVLAQIAANHQRPIQLGQFGNGHAQPTRLALGVGKFGMAQTVVDIAATQCAHQLRRQPQLFYRAVRAGQQAHAGSALFFGNVAQAAGCIFQRGLPAHLEPAPVLLDHGRGQPVGAMQRLVAEAVAVGNPALIDGFVLKRHHAQHAVVFDLHDQVRARGVMRADAFAPRQLPRARRVAKRLVGQRAHRADVDHVAREFGVDGVADKSLDLAVLATMRHAQLHLAGNFHPKAHAARALDAAVHLFHGDERPHILGNEYAFFFFVARAVLAIAHGQVLQQTLAALVADGAIQRVVDEQKLHHALLRLDRFHALGAHHHAVNHGRGARRHRIGLLFDIHQAHAAVGRNRELLVIAEMRDEDARLLGSLDDHAALGHLNLLAVDIEFDHLNASPAVMGTAQRPCSMW